MDRLLSTSCLVTQRAYIQNCSQFWRRLRSDVWRQHGRCPWICWLKQGLRVWQRGDLCTLNSVSWIRSCCRPKPPDALIWFFWYAVLVPGDGVDRELWAALAQLRADTLYRANYKCFGIRENWQPTSRTAVLVPPTLWILGIAIFVFF